MTKILQIDKREPIEKIKLTINKLIVKNKDWQDIEIIYKSLPHGDYLLTNNDSTFLIERKTYHDFAGSYPLLKERLMKMRMEYNRIGLLLEGEYIVKNGKMWLWEGRKAVPRLDYILFNNYLISQQEKGLHLFYTKRLSDTLARLLITINYLPKLDNPSCSIKIDNINEWFLLLGGIGEVTIRKLKEKYNSPMQALNNINEWHNEKINILKSW